MKHLFAAAALASAALTSACAPVGQRPESSAPTVAPTRFTVTVEGTGPDVILIPGLATSREVWNGARAALRGNYRLHLVQLNGFGGSEAGVNAQGGILPGTVAELSAYIEANGLRQPAIVGHSVGGFLALLMARSHPEQVGRVMIVDSLPFIGILFDPASTAAGIEPRAAAMRDALKARSTMPRPTPEQAAQAATGQSRSEAGRMLVGRWTYQADPAVMGQLAYETMVTDLRADLPSIRVPITMLFPWDEGTLSEAQSRALYENAYRGAPRARLVGIPNSQHFIMVDQPAMFIEQLRAFLSETPDRP